jgi:hypothetical protein
MSRGALEKLPMNHKTRDNDLEKRIGARVSQTPKYLTPPPQQKHHPKPPPPILVCIHSALFACVNGENGIRKPQRYRTTPLFAHSLQSDTPSPPPEVIRLSFTALGKPAARRCAHNCISAPSTAADAAAPSLCFLCVSITVCVLHYCTSGGRMTHSFSHAVAWYTFRSMGAARVCRPGAAHSLGTEKG